MRPFYVTPRVLPGRRLLLLLGLFASFTPALSAQEREIRGRVLSSDGEPLPGVRVSVKSTLLTALTHGDGSYSIVVPAGATTLLYTSLGYRTIARHLPTDEPVLNVILHSVPFPLDEILVIGQPPSRNSPDARLAHLLADSTLSRALEQAGLLHAPELNMDELPPPFPMEHVACADIVSPEVQLLYSRPEAPLRYLRWRLNLYKLVRSLQTPLPVCFRKNSTALDQPSRLLVNINSRLLIARHQGSVVRLYGYSEPDEAGFPFLALRRADAVKSGTSVYFAGVLDPLVGGQAFLYSRRRQVLYSIDPRGDLPYDRQLK